MRDRSRIVKTFHFFRCCCHRASAAFRAPSALCLGVSFLARALPPFKPPSRPKATAAAFFSVSAIGSTFTQNHNERKPHSTTERTQPVPFREHKSCFSAAGPPLLEHFPCGQRCEASECVMTQKDKAHPATRIEQDQETLTRICKECNTSYTIDQFRQSSSNYFDPPYAYRKGCKEYCLKCWLGVSSKDTAAAS